MDQTFEDGRIHGTLEHGLDAEITPSLLEGDLNSSRNPVYRRNRNFKRCVIFLVISLVVAYFVTIYWHSHSKQIIATIFKTVHQLVTADKWYSYTIFFAIEFIFSWVLIPGAMYFDIALAYFMKDFWKPFWIIFIGPCVASQISFFFIRYCFRQSVEKRFGSKKIFRAIRYEVDQQPWTASFMVSAILIPMAIKNYSLPLTSLNYWQYMIPSVPFFAFYAALLTHTGLTITQLKELFHPKKFQEKSSAEKLELYFNWGMLLLTVVVIAFIARKLQTRLKSFDQEEKSDQRKTELATITDFDQEMEYDQLDHSGVVSL